MFRRRLFTPGNVDEVMDHADRNAAANTHTQADTKEQLARAAEVTAKVWCKPEEGYDDLDRQAYRAAWYHRMRIRNGW
jgi:hypothetical protein